MDIMSSSNTSKEAAAMMASPPNEEAVAARNIKAKQARQQVAPTSVAGERRPRPKLDQRLNCPRCDSTNTKFCYYNNYSLTQPRYYCKACHRYWTQGGILRNVPIGGSCRKNKNKPQRTVAAASFGLPPTSASSSSSRSSKNIIIINNNNNNNAPQLMMMPTTAMPTTDFPNVLPTLTSSTEIPRSGRDHQHQVSLPFAPLSLPCNPPDTTLFMDLMRGGGLPFLPPPSFGFGVMQQHGHGVMMGGSSTDQQQQLVSPLLQGQSLEEVKPPMAGGGVPHQWAPNASGAAQQGGQHQVVDSGDSGNNNHHNSREYCDYWQGGGGRGGLNNSSSSFI